MRSAKPLVSLLCTFLLVMPVFGQEAPARSIAILDPPQAWHSRFSRNYTPKDVSPINLSNSGRLEELMRAGQIYLSLADAIALAIENNLDIEIARYGPKLAQSDLRKAQAGSAPVARSTAVSTGPSSATGASTSGSNLASQTTVTSTTTGGVSVPSFDPAVTANVNWGHFTTPQLNSFIVGTSSVVATNTTYNFGILQGFASGAQASLNLNNRNQLSSSSRVDFNPATTSDLDLQLSQPLLQGFGLALNRRFIRIATNNLKVSDLTFRQQLITTVTSVCNLYWDLVSFTEDVKVKKQALVLAQKLYSDNQKQVEIGTLAPIEVVRAEAEVASREQDLTVSESNVLQQETILKNVLSRTGVASPTVALAHIIPTDRIRVPEAEALAPIQDLVTKALDSRPELESTRIQLDNSKISLKASKNALMPTLSAVVFLRNNAQSGSVSTLPVAAVTGQPAVPRDPKNYDPFFIGSYATILRQMFGRSFPDYQVGAQLNVPIRNRSAQADVISAELQLRQNELRQQQQLNSVRVEVQNALIGIQQARARYQAAVKNRVLQEQTLDAEQKKYALGASTIFLVIQAQRDLATAQGNEVAAQAQYARARTEIERATGQALESNNVIMDEALTGSVSRKPAPLPPAQQP
jgi:outer membrane protein